MITNRRHKTVKIICDNCHKECDYRESDLKRFKTHCCSKKCRDELHSTKEIVICKLCNKEFKKPLADIKRCTNNFCSNDCSIKYLNSMKRSSVQRSKLEIFYEDYIKNNYGDLSFVCNDRDFIKSELDFFFPEHNFAIEVHGPTHFEPIYGQKKLIQTQINDQKKASICREKGINLHVINSANIKRLTEHNKIKLINTLSTILDYYVNNI